MTEHAGSSEDGRSDGGQETPRFLLGRASFTPCEFHSHVGQSAGGDTLNGQYRHGCEWCLMSTISNLIIVVQGLETQVSRLTATVTSLATGSEK